MRVATYSRVSTEEQKTQGFSLQDQERRLQEYCAINQHEIVANYSDDKSGKTFDRPSFQLFLREIKIKNIEALICVRYDRFSRNAEKTLSMIASLREKGVEVLFIEQNIDMSIPENLMMHMIYSVMPQIENERRGLNTKKGMRQALREGRWLWKAPFGYRNDKDSKSIEPDERAIYVTKAFEAIGNDRKGPMETYEALKEEGFTASRQTFLDMLRRPIYYGGIRVKAWRNEPEQEIIGQHAPLISKVLFDKVQERLNRKERRKNVVRSNKDLFPLRGLLSCPECASKLTGSESQGRNKRYAYYHCQGSCKHRVGTEKANSAVEDLLSELSFHDDIIDVYRDVLWDVMQSKNLERGDEIKVAQIQIQNLGKQQERLDEQFLAGKITSDSYNRLLVRIENESREASQRIQQTQSNESLQRDQVYFGVSMLSDLVNKYRKADVEAKQKMIGSIFSGKLCFDGKKYRTADLNPAVELMLNGIKPFERAQKKQASKNRDLSCLAPPPGLEPGTL